MSSFNLTGDTTQAIYGLVNSSHYSGESCVRNGTTKTPAAVNVPRKKTIPSNMRLMGQVADQDAQGPAMLAADRDITANSKRSPAAHSLWLERNIPSETQYQGCNRCNHQDKQEDHQLLPPEEAARPTWIISPQRERLGGKPRPV